ncbi:MAG: type I glyceraldehyde-3-phosphate dehydrogenase [Dehalococcoidales bacterium]|nr:type I glyceraldehyde-3-phosphate dehydrogenase [Dehalococcoidales bacterium]
MTVRIGINGFGRIGRCVLKHCIARDDLEVVAVNDLTDVSDLAYLLKYDSVHGWYPREITCDEAQIKVGDHTIDFFSITDPSKIPWKEVGADVVIESTGVFKTRAKAAKHLEGGARRVIISAPSDDPDIMIVLGVNDDKYDPKSHQVISLASCTTNSLAPVAKVLNDTFGIENLVFTTIHAYTSSQSLMDTPMSHRRRGRAAALSIIPTTTGAAGALEKVLPELTGKTKGIAMRVPVPDGSITDIVATLNKDVTAEEVNNALIQASQRPELKNILRVSDEALVSRDIIGDFHSAIIDSENTAVLNNRIVKLLSWYDNEWGYSSRLADFATIAARELL